MNLIHRHSEMKIKVSLLLCLVILFFVPCLGQIPTDTHVAILKAEDTRSFSNALAGLIESTSEPVRKRAILAAGRIGDEKAVPILISRLSKQISEQEKAVILFALGEIESLKAGEAVVRELSKADNADIVRAKAVEAAGKIAAANSSDLRSKDLGESILDTLEFEDRRGKDQHTETILLALTAALRTRPEEAETVVSNFLTNLDPRIRSDAANSLARLRAQNANVALRAMLMSDNNPVARANAARALGSANDTGSSGVLIDAAVNDEDSRVRVSAIRSLGMLKATDTAEKLIERGESLFKTIKRTIKPNYDPAEKGELIEIASVLGTLLKSSKNARAFLLLSEFGEADRYRTAETEIALAKIDAQKFTTYLTFKDPKYKTSVAAVNSGLEGIGELADLDDSEENAKLKAEAVKELRKGLLRYSSNEISPKVISIPTLLTTLAAFKPDGLDAELRHFLKDEDIFVRTTAAELLGSRPITEQNLLALQTAFLRSLSIDKRENDALLALLSAMFKLDGIASVETGIKALSSPDYLVRKRAFELLSNKDILSKRPDLQRRLEESRTSKLHEVLPYQPKTGTKLGQTLNSDADYRRAALRKNGSVKAVFTTQKGSFNIELLPEEAPLTVDNFIKLANSKYFDGLEIHRVVPNFVMQDGDPLGNGSGGPGWSIRCEINMVSYERGVVGMALSGKDTGGSQWFVTHSPQPHLDGGYTVFGKVNEKDMTVVDKIVRGDKILTVRIASTSKPVRPRSRRR